MDILTEGRSVFRLVEVLDEKEYYEGWSNISPMNPLKSTPAKQTKLVDLFEKCHVLLFGRPWEQGEPSDPATLAYRMAARLPMELRSAKSCSRCARKATAASSCSNGSRVSATACEREKMRKRAEATGTP